ncbi:MAG: hypothetical protein AB1805_07390 [Nitrospirota bacterium]
MISGVLYRCTFGHREVVRCEPPDAWPVKRYPGLICKQCGAFLYPAELDGVRDLKTIFYMFATCPHAYQCQTNGYYAAECEEPYHITPRCLSLVMRVSTGARARGLYR